MGHGAAEEDRQVPLRGGVGVLAASEQRRRCPAVLRGNPKGQSTEGGRTGPTIAARPEERSDAMAESVSERANAIHEADRRVDALIAVMLDRSKGWQQRTQAIGFLVPDEMPSKCPDRKVDEALLQLFDRGQGDSIINFTLAIVCDGVAMRGRTEYFDRMWLRFNEEKEGEARSRMRMSLVHLALRGTEDERTKLFGRPRGVANADRSKPVGRDPGPLRPGSPGMEGRN